MKFKVGDKVIATRVYSCFGKGKIIDIKCENILVEFVTNIKGHDGSTYGCILGKQGHCWWLYEDNLELDVPKKVIPYGIVKFMEDINVKSRR